MFPADLISIFQWWVTFFVIGIIFLPLTSLIFSSFFDKGYIFAKILGVAIISYVVFVLGIFKILPFTEFTIYLIIFSSLLFNFILISKYSDILISIKRSWKIFLFEEILFLATFIFWSYIRAHQPDIHGLEKYEDFGFINSILRSEYFPPRDMWFTPLSINYYYFGHVVTATLTKLSNIPSHITFNLMLATIFAFTFTGIFSIGLNLFNTFLAATKIQKINPSKIFRSSVAVGMLSGFLASMGGNLHTIYTFFKPYQNENPVPFWELAFSPQTFPNSYWYPNATRFIQNTIHEFPSYSFVVSDLHAHVLDMPFVFLAIAVFFSILLSKNINLFKTLSVSFLLAVMYMTNAWDGMIYFILSVIIIGYVIFKPSVNLEETKNQKIKIKNLLKNENLKLKIKYLLTNTVILGIGFVIFTLPFNLNFKPFASGIGILCAPDFLVNLERFGPFIFEANHCQHSPIWQLLILYGFFYFWVFSFIIFLFRKTKLKIEKLPTPDIFILILVALSTLLIIIPEFIYVKDIYPAHYRANTMFKLIYQSFIMLSLSSGYIIVRLFLNHKSLILNRPYWRFAYWLIGLLMLILVSLYPYFSINSYFGNLKNYSGINGTNYLKSLYPNDYEAILWINKNIENQPVILEAQGDSYTDYARVSSNTGLPTVLGWTVHEWLWRGTYDIPAPRIAEIAKIYESQDPKETKNLLKKYNISLVFIGNLEKQKYPALYEEKFKSLGQIIYQKGETKIFKVYPAPF